MLLVWTQRGPSEHPEVIAPLRRSGSDFDGLAPDDALMSAIARAGQWHDLRVWPDLERTYQAAVGAWRRRYVKRWRELTSRAAPTIACSCYESLHCHRVWLARYLVTYGRVNGVQITYLGERETPI